MSNNLCRSCGQPVVWAAHHETGRLAPIDPAPNPAGNVVLLPKGRYRVLSAGEQPVGDRFTSHFATCAHAPAWRRAA